jgi:uroporphyrinogen decarboxylase
MVISDVGAQRGPLMSRTMFDEFIAPYLAEIAEVIHMLGAKIMFHSCGNIAAFIPSIIHCGVDILNPIQPVGREMSPAALAQYQDQLCFHGGIDVQWLLPKGTPHEVHRDVRRYANAFDRGYIACPAHLFQPDTPAENIVAFYQAFD